MYGDDGGDLHFVAWKVKASTSNFSATQGEFGMTRCDLSGIFDDSVSPSRLYDIVQNDTVTGIVFTEDLTIVC